MSLMSVNGKKFSFYLHPITHLMPVQWFSDRAVGVNTLHETVKMLATAAGLSGKFTNHSLHATAAMHMYDSGVPEKFIKEITRHRSDAVRVYERMSDEMKCKVLVTIGSGKKVVYKS